MFREGIIKLVPISKAMKLLLTFIFFCGLQNLSFSQVSNVLPMYGPGTKTKEHNKLDKEFISNVVKEHGSRQKACEVHIDFAWRYFYNNDLETAMKRFNQAWLLNPNYPDSFYGFSALTRINNHEEALKYEQKGLKLDSDKARAIECFQHSANCLEQLNQIDATIYYYSRLIDLNPLTSFYYKKRGYLLSSSNQLKDALKDYNTAIQLDPNDAMTLNNRGYMHQQDRNLAQAIDDYTDALAIDPDYISARLNRSLSYMESGKPNKALDDINRCIELDKEHGPFYSLKGQILFELDQIEEACDSFETAMKFGDNSIEELFYTVCTRTIEIERK